ncbi:hypothetical protein ACX1C1_08710 [Paenibacillus sp. strain BS8-2]
MFDSFNFFHHELAVPVKKFLVSLGCMLIVVVLWQFMTGWSFEQTRHIPGKVKVMLSQDTAFGKAILFENELDGSFGVARVDRKWDVLYRYDGGSSGYRVEEGKPFQAAGIATGTGEKKDRFVAGVKTAQDSKIKYIVFGGHMEGVSPWDPYSLTLDEVRRDSDTYQIQELQNQYALFVLDDYSEDTWTIRAFDENGRLVAHKLFAGDERYIDWE